MVLLRGLEPRFKPYKDSTLTFELQEYALREIRPSLRYNFKGGVNDIKIEKALSSRSTPCFYLILTS